jgi:hypothetical protein
LKQITVDNQPFNIPSSWNEITIQQQINVERYNKQFPDLGIVCILAGYLNLSIEDVKKLHINTISKLISEFDFIKAALKSDPVFEFEHNSNKYFVIPSMLAGQFQDYISLETIREQHKENLYEALPKLIAILAKRKDETLDSYDIIERSKEFYSLPITIANGLYAFFLTSAILLNQDCEQLAVQENQKLLESINYIKTTLMKPDGSGSYTRLQKATLLKYVKFIEKHWNKYYSGYNLNQENRN